MTEPVAYMDRTRRYYEAQGFDKAYAWANFDETPFAELVKPLSESRLAVVTTAALYDREASDPRYVASFEVADPPGRLFANDLAWDKSATHMNDRGTYLPLEPLESAVSDGRIGGLTRRFHCAPTDYSIRRTLESDAPTLLERCYEDGADAVLLVPL